MAQSKKPQDGAELFGDSGPTPDQVTAASLLCVPAACLAVLAVRPSVDQPASRVHAALCGVPRDLGSDEAIAKLEAVTASSAAVPASPMHPTAAVSRISRCDGRGCESPTTGPNHRCMCVPQPAPAADSSSPSLDSDLFGMVRCRAECATGVGLRRVAYVTPVVHRGLLAHHSWEAETLRKVPTRPALLMRASLIW